MSTPAGCGRRPRSGLRGALDNGEIVGAAPGDAKMKRLVRLAIAGILLGVVLYWFVDPRALVAQLLECSPLALVAAGAFIIAGRLVVAWRWHLLVRSTHATVGFGELSRLVLMGSSLGFVGPGAIGTEAYRVTGLGRRTGVGVAVASVVVERLTSLFGLVLLIAAGLLMASLPMPRSLLVFLVIGCIAALTAIGLALAAPLHKRVLPFFQPLPRRVRTKLEETIAAAGIYAGQPVLLVQLAGLSVLLQLLRLGSALAIAFGLGMEVGIGVLLVVVPIGIFLGMVPLTPHGLGTRELTYVALLGLVGVAPEPAAALSLLLTIVAAIVCVVPALWFYLLHGVWGHKTAPRSTGE
jgi:glycosyltransferase 2 family protein